MSGGHASRKVLQAQFLVVSVLRGYRYARSMPTIVQYVVYRLDLIASHQQPLIKRQTKLCGDNHIKLSSLTNSNSTFPHQALELYNLTPN